MTFKKKMGRKSRYARNKEKDEVREIVNDSMYIKVDPYNPDKLNDSISYGTADGNITLTFKDLGYKNEPVLPVIKEERISIVKRIKNFINKLFK